MAAFFVDHCFYLSNVLPALLPTKLSVPIDLDFFETVSYYGTVLVFTFIN